MYDGLRFFKVRISLEDEFDTFLLRGSPLVARDHQGVSATGKQFRLCITIGETLRNEGHVLAERFPAPFALLVLFASVW